LTGAPAAPAFALWEEGAEPNQKGRHLSWLATATTIRFGCSKKKKPGEVTQPGFEEMRKESQRGKHGGWDAALLINLDPRN
jgi:hypothetical protein